MSAVDWSLTPLLVVAGKASVMLMLTGVVIRMQRHASASQRHLTWMTGLGAALILPLASQLTPEWNVLSVVAHTSTPEWSATIRNELAPFLSAAARTRWTWESVLIAIWLIGATICLGHLLVGMLATRRWRKHARPIASASWRRAIPRALQQTSVERTVEFRECDWILVPCTWGLRRPIILLPTATDAWTDDRCQSALMHELAHVHRGDVGFAMLARLACALHWYNPLVWWAAREAAAQREQACDDVVIAGGAVASEYAQLLVDAAQTRPMRISTWARALSLSQPSRLDARVRAVLNARVQRAPVTHRANATAAIVAMLALLILAPLSVAQSRPASNARASQTGASNAPQTSDAVRAIAAKVCERSSAARPIVLPATFSVVVSDSSKASRSQTPNRFTMTIARCPNATRAP